MKCIICNRKLAESLKNGMVEVYTNFEEKRDVESKVFLLYLRYPRRTFGAFPGLLLDQKPVGQMRVQTWSTNPFSWKSF